MEGSIMIRVEIEVSTSERPNDVAAVARELAGALMGAKWETCVIHRLAIEEADA